MGDNYSNFDPFFKLIKTLICRREFQNKVGRVPGIYERKRTGVLLEIDEKQELPNNVSLRSKRFFARFV